MCCFQRRKSSVVVFQDGCTTRDYFLLVHGPGAGGESYRLPASVDIVVYDGDVFAVRGPSGGVRGHGGGLGGQPLHHVVHHLCHRGDSERRPRATGRYTARVGIQALVARRVRVGVRDVLRVCVRGRVCVRDGGAVGAARLRLRHLPLLPRGSGLLRCFDILHPVREQLPPHAEERRGHAGTLQVRLLNMAVPLTPHERNRDGRHVVLLRRYYVKCLVFYSSGVRNKLLFILMNIFCMKFVK
ncbi:unnamed protein product [Diatraea saccharalis]|uniref:Uncharacterized protein n=1 Tax=Diatraea saccharalis TaxID=40085 RepID=A0A9N9WBZ3_9NEOP|nr:unnamed protein product [Diatraea saccharalis]